MMEVEKERRNIEYTNKWNDIRDILTYYSEHDIIEIENAENYENEIFNLACYDAIMYDAIMYSNY
jgi:hypothetical protein